MKMKRLAIIPGLLLCLLYSITDLKAEVQRQDKPNVVYLLADDFGWAGLSAHKGDIPTPTIDRLFEQGVEMRNFMGWCVCSPTRAMLLTGRHPFRVGTGPEVGGELEKEETTIAEAFKMHGYQTGVFGKWHNGGDPLTPEFEAAFQEAFKNMPNKTLKGGWGANEHGFDEAWVYYGGGEDYFTRKTVKGNGPVSWWHNRQFRPQDSGYTEDLITQHALEFIRANKDRPFFCYVPFHIVHNPLQAKEQDLQKVDPSITDPTKRLYHAMVQAMDRNVAMILAELDKLGLRDNTIVVFTSDNGATKDGSNLPFKLGKHSIYEGGVHLPTVIHWPAGKVQGSQWDGLCGALDMFPTLMAMADLKMPPTRPLDGKNIWPALGDNGPSPVESYYWAWRNEDAIRTADWKLHRFFDHVELYDMRKDVSETINLAEANPQVVTMLMGKMDEWVKSLGVALTHQPVPAILDAKPNPEEEVLEISLTVANQADPKERLVIPFANNNDRHLATDYLEYDILVATESLSKGFYYSPFKGNDSKEFQLLFKRGEGIDQFGREQATGPEPKGGPGVWEHRVIGLSSSAPGSGFRHGAVFSGRFPGNYKIYLDNLRIRHADGSFSWIWTGSKDTRKNKFEDSASFKTILVRAVPLTELDMKKEKATPTATASTPANPSSTKKKPMHVLLIVSDDLRCSLGCYGVPAVSSPNIDRLAARGVLFERAYCQYPVCNPSRTSFMTGLRCEQTGVTDNSLFFRDRIPDVATMPQILRAQGWTARSYGKILHAGLVVGEIESRMLDIGKSWDEAAMFDATAAGKKGQVRDLTGGLLKWCKVGQMEGSDEDQADGQTAVKVIQSIEELTAAGKPWFLGAGFHRPHDPFLSPKKYFEPYPKETLRLYHDPADMTPAYPLTIGGGDFVKAFNAFTDDDRLDFLQAYYAGVSFTDAQVGRLLDTLDRLKLWDNTLVIFLGDNGYHHNERNWWNKNTLFERSCRIPLIVCAPGGQQGKVCRGLVELVDLFPTVTDYCGVQPPQNLAGQSLRPLLINPDQPGRKAAYTLVTRGTNYGRSVRTDRWRYTQWSDGTSELYDEANDPDENYNLSGKEQHRAVIETLTKLIDELPPFKPVVK